MADNETERYDQIRSIAGKNWMKGASVSLARLDQVKARVYNMGFADNHALKAVIGNAHVTTARKEPVPEPPLSKLTIQRNAWGSNTSIPDLIRQQSERQKIRPESAKTRASSRPQPGRRRPQSAKEFKQGNNNASNRPPPHPGSAECAMGVRGAHYEPGERPPEGVVHQAAPSYAYSGIMSEKTTQDITIDGEKSHNGCNMTLPPEPPPAPCGSPELSEIDLLSADINGMELFTEEDTNGADKSPVLLRRPTPEPISFSLPQADFDDDIEDEDLNTDRLLGEDQSKLPYRHSKDGHKQNMPRQSVVNRKLHIGEKDTNSTRSDQQMVITTADMPNEGVETVDNLFDGCMPGMKPRPKRPNVVFAEDKNVTVDITPRDQLFGDRIGEEQGARPYSGKRSLKHVRSKTDSGVHFAFNRPVSRTSHNESSRKLSQTYTPPRNLISHRPKSSKGRVPTISVQFVDDGESVDDHEPTPNNTKVIMPKRHDVESMMSKLSFEDKPKTQIEDEIVIDDEGNESDGECSPVSLNPASQTKITSGRQKNYYDMSVKSDNNLMSTKRCNHKQLTKTVKTISLAEDRSVEETRNVLTMDGYEYTTHGYCPPQHARPTSSVGHRQDKSHWNARNKNKNDETLQPEDDNRHTTTGLLKKRPTSSPSYRKSLHVTEKKSTSFKIRPSSATKAQNSVCKRLHSHSDSSLRGQQDKTSMSETKRANAAVQAARHTSNKQIAALNRSFLELSAGRSSKKKEEEPPKEVIEIWTRKTDGLELETEGLKECRALQERLLNSGIPVTLESLKRALLPPTEYGFYGSSYGSNSFPGHSSGLLTHPSTWMPDEYKKIRTAQKAVKTATSLLRAQEREERRQMSATSSSSSLRTKTKKTKTGQKSSKT